MMRKDGNRGPAQQALGDSQDADNAEALREARVRTISIREDALAATLNHVLNTMPLSEDTRARIAHLITDGRNEL